MLTHLRHIVGTMAFVGLVLSTACASGATPTPTTAPVKPAAATAPPAAATATTPAKPAEQTKAPEAAKPAAAKPAEAAKPAAAAADATAEWTKVVDAAKKEAKLVVIVDAGEAGRNAVMEFQKAYPDIKVESTLESAALWPKIVGERNAGQFLWDLRVGGVGTTLRTLKPEKLIDPVKPAIIHPEVLDNSKWVGGFDGGWIDKEAQYIYAFVGYLHYSFWVNRDTVPESELKSLDQLLDPKWKGKILIGDPRRPGPVSTTMGYLHMLKGPDWIKKLFAQDPVIMGDDRQVVEAAVRGRYPIASGIAQDDLEVFLAQGLGKNLKPLAADTAEGAALTPGRGSLVLINKAPHPNAAKVFINWMLSKAGQQTFATITKTNSRRIDVEGPAATAPRPNVTYKMVDDEANSPNKSQVIDIAKEIFK